MVDDFIDSMLENIDHDTWYETLKEDDPYYLDYYQDGLSSGIAIPTRVDKVWGWEIHSVNFWAYYSKILHIKTGLGTSCHLHLEKHETLTVTEGQLLVKVYNKIKGGSGKTYLLAKGESFIIPPGLVHSLHCPASSECCELIESSTFSKDSDSIRIG